MKARNIIISFFLIVIIFSFGTVFSIVGENKAIENSPYLSKLVIVSKVYSASRGQDKCTIKMKDGKPTPCCDDGNHVACTFDTDCAATME